MQFLWDTLEGNLVGHCCTSSLQNERFVRDFLQESHVSSKIHSSSLQNERFARDFLKNSHLKSAKQAFRTRLPSKSHASSLQNKRFARDLLQKSRVKSPKRMFFVRDFLQNSPVKVSKSSIWYETSSKVKREAPSEHIHQAALPSSFAIPAPPNNARSHANPNVTATFTPTTSRNLTIPCACHEKLTRPHV